MKTPTRWQRAISAELERWEFLLVYEIDYPDIDKRITTYCRMFHIYQSCTRCPLVRYGIAMRDFTKCFPSLHLRPCGFEERICQIMAVLMYLHELSEFTEKEIREASL